MGRLPCLSPTLLQLPASGGEEPQALEVCCVRRKVGNHCYRGPIAQLKSVSEQTLGSIRVTLLICGGLKGEPLVILGSQWLAGASLRGARFGRSHSPAGFVTPLLQQQLIEPGK